MCRNFRLKHFCVSYDGNKIASDAIEYFCKRFIICVASCTQAMPKRHSIGRITSHMISRKCAE